MDETAVWSVAGIAAAFIIAVVVGWFFYWLPVRRRRHSRPTGPVGIKIGKGSSDIRIEGNRFRGMGTAIDSEGTDVSIKDNKID